MEEIVKLYDYVVPAIVAYLVWIHHKVTNHDVAIATSNVTHGTNGEELKKIHKKLDELINSVHNLEIKMLKNGSSDIPS